jgi:glycosyltransferase involved in cell wall biosynthesis
MNKKMTHSEPTISIIVPCYNESQFLPKLLDSFEKLDVDKNFFELIIVDNGSDDNSVEIASNKGVKVLLKPNANISAVRNFGVQHAKGKLIAFLDADCLPTNEWLHNSLQYIDTSEIGLFGSIPQSPADSTWVERAWHEINIEGTRDVGFICTANMFIKRTVFDEVKGFNENLVTGEDYDLCQRVLSAGYRVVYNSTLSVIHLRYPKTLVQRFLKEVWYGKEMFKILKINPLYRPFWASLIYGISAITIFSTILFDFHALVFYPSVILFFSISILSTLGKVNSTKKYHKVMQLFLIFQFYLAGRFVSILIASFQHFFHKR